MLGTPSACYKALAPAKLNLFLELRSRRADGYHELTTVLTPIGLYDIVYFLPIEHSSIEFSQEVWTRGGASDVPGDATNLVVRAASLLQRESGIRAGGQIHLIKRIPARSGLGGGSSDAAATLLAANRAWNLNWPASRLVPLAAQLGSDVPFFLGQGAGLFTGRGATFRHAVRLPRLFFVVAVPTQGNATSSVYARCRVPESPRSVPVPFLQDGSVTPRQLTSVLFNRLTEPADDLNPDTPHWRGLLARAGGSRPTTSGSGSACFGVFANAVQARIMARKLACQGSAQVYSVANVRGVQVQQNELPVSLQKVPIWK